VAEQETILYVHVVGDWAEFDRQAQQRERTFSSEGMRLPVGGGGIAAGPTLGAPGGSRALTFAPATSIMSAQQQLGQMGFGGFAAFGKPMQERHQLEMLNSVGTYMANALSFPGFASAWNRPTTPGISQLNMFGSRSISGAEVGLDPTQQIGGFYAHSAGPKFPQGSIGLSRQSGPESIGYLLSHELGHHVYRSGMFPGLAQRSDDLFGYMSEKLRLKAVGKYGAAEREEFFTESFAQFIVPKSMAGGFGNAGGRYGGLPPVMQNALGSAMGQQQSPIEISSVSGAMKELEQAVRSVTMTMKQIGWSGPGTLAYRGAEGDMNPDVTAAWHRRQLAAPEQQIRSLYRGMNLTPADAGQMLISGYTPWPHPSGRTSFTSTGGIGRMYAQADTSSLGSQRPAEGGEPVIMRARGLSGVRFVHDPHGYESGHMEYLVRPQEYDVRMRRVAESEEYGQATYFDISPRRSRLPVPGEHSFAVNMAASGRRLPGETITDTAVRHRPSGRTSIGGYHGEAMDNLFENMDLGPPEEFEGNWREFQDLFTTSAGRLVSRRQARGIPGGEMTPVFGRAPRLRTAGGQFASGQFNPLVANTERGWTFGGGGMPPDEPNWTWGRVPSDENLPYAERAWVQSARPAMAQNPLMRRGIETIFIPRQRGGGMLTGGPERLALPAPADLGFPREVFEGEEVGGGGGSMEGDWERPANRMLPPGGGGSFGGPPYPPNANVHPWAGPPGPGTGAQYPHPALAGIGAGFGGPRRGMGLRAPNFFQRLRWNAGRAMARFPRGVAFNAFFGLWEVGQAHRAVEEGQLQQALATDVPTLLQGANAQVEGAGRGPLGSILSLGIDFADTMTGGSLITASPGDIRQRIQSEVARYNLITQGVQYASERQSGIAIREAYAKGGTSGAEVAQIEQTRIQTEKQLTQQAAFLRQQAGAKVRTWGSYLIPYSPFSGIYHAAGGEDERYILDDTTRAGFTSTASALQQKIQEGRDNEKFLKMQHQNQVAIQSSVIQMRGITAAAQFSGDPRTAQIMALSAQQQLERDQLTIQAPQLLGALAQTHRAEMVALQFQQAIDLGVREAATSTFENVQAMQASRSPYRAQRMQIVGQAVQERIAAGNDFDAYTQAGRRETAALDALDTIHFFNESMAVHAAESGENIADLHRQSKNFEARRKALDEAGFQAINAIPLDEPDRRAAVGRKNVAEQRALVRDQHAQRYFDTYQLETQEEVTGLLANAYGPGANRTRRRAQVAGITRAAEGRAQQRLYNEATDTENADRERRIGINQLKGARAEYLQGFQAQEGSLFRTNLSPKGTSDGPEAVLKDIRDGIDRLTSKMGSILAIP
jgi:hypothetical protein